LAEHLQPKTKQEKPTMRTGRVGEASALETVLCMDLDYGYGFYY